MLVRDNTKNRGTHGDSLFMLGGLPPSSKNPLAFSHGECQALVYQLENQTFLNDNNVGTNELFTQIAEFNGDVVASREGLKNPWVNWFYSPLYHKIELIEYGTANSD